MQTLLQDVRFGWRSLRNSPGFTLITILTLALGIGANSAIFSLINGVLLKPLPYPDPDRLYWIFLSDPNFPKFPLNPNDFVDYRSQNRVFEDIAAFTREDLQLSEPDRPERLAALRVSKRYFEVLGFRPALGRTFDAQDELKGNEQVVILSDSIWRRRFNAERGIIGRKILLNEQPCTVVGVMPAAFQHVGGDYRSLPHGNTVDAWWPFTLPANRAARGSHFLNGIGRLRRGITAQTALQDMNRIAAELGRQYPASNKDWHIRLESLYQELVGPSERMLIVLLGAVGFVLLIACVNAANLLLARATARTREIAVRAALGAGRLRIMRQVLTESVMISIAAGLLGALMAFEGVEALTTFVPADFPRAHMIHLDGMVFGFTFVTAILTGILFGLAPALQSAGVDLNQSLRDGGRGSTTGARHLRLRRLLVVTEVCLACVLLIGSGLLMRSFINLLRLDPGFRSENVITAEVTLPRAHYKDGKMIAGFYGQLLERIRSLPGVREAGAGSDLPWTGYNENSGFNVEGRPASYNDQAHARYHVATPGYFSAIGVPLLRGRFFTTADKDGAPKVIIINQSFARKYWPGEDATGKRITFANKPKDEDWMTVSGIVGDVKDAPTSIEAEPASWWPHAQQPFGVMILTVRTASDPVASVGMLRRELQSLDRDLPLADVRTLQVVAEASVSGARFILFLVGLFSMLALTLAAVGTYGVISYAVTQRTYEFGVRMALGARSANVVKLVMAEGLKLACVGVAAGAVLALAAGRVLRSLLYGVSVSDPLTLTIVPAGALLIALLACYIPARRATQADPTIALRAE